MLDEFNRATPRMQSGLLEAMEEHAVTVGKRRHALPRPFFCIGTMNPHDNSGTFELAHASCDRFAMRTGIGYPSENGERDLLTRFSNADRREESDPIVAPGDVVQLQKVIAQLPAAEAVRAYLVRLLRSTREHPDVLVGASPRALLSMYRCAQAAALLDNAAEVAVKHVRSLFEPCIAHRIRVRPDASARAVCEEILERTPVPVTAPAADDRRERQRAAPGRARAARRLELLGPLSAAAQVRRCSSTTGSSRSSYHQRASRFSTPTNSRSAARRPSVSGLAGVAGARRAGRAPRRESASSSGSLASSGVAAREQHVDVVAGGAARAPGRAWSSTRRSTSRSSLPP